MESLQAFIEGQEKNPIVPQREINPDQLQKKINQIPKLDDIQDKKQLEEVEQNGLKLSKKSSILDGAVNITGGPTIRSIKNLRKKTDFKLKMKRKNEVEKEQMIKSISTPTPAIVPLKPKTSAYIPQNKFKYVPQKQKINLKPKVKEIER